MPRDDAKLVEGWQRGDPTAFEAIVRRWQAPVGRFLARMVGSAEVAQDLSQEVFLRVYQARDRYHENGAFQVWLYRIALNAAHDAVRRERKQPQPIENCESESLIDSPESECQRNELADAVAAAIGNLPDTLREVLVLRHYEEMSFVDMSRLLKAPASTLKSRFATALTRVRGQLREMGFLQEDNQP